VLLVASPIDSLGVSAAVPFSKKENKALPKLAAASQRKFLAISNRTHALYRGTIELRCPTDMSPELGLCEPSHSWTRRYLRFKNEEVKKFEK